MSSKNTINKTDMQKLETSLSQRKKKFSKLSLNKQKDEHLKENYEIDFSDSDCELQSSVLTNRKKKKAIILNKVAADNVLKRKSLTESQDNVKRSRNDVFEDTFSCFDDTQTLLSNTIKSNECDLHDDSRCNHILKIERVVCENRKDESHKTDIKDDLLNQSLVKERIVRKCSINHDATNIPSEMDKISSVNRNNNNSNITAENLINKEVNCNPNEGMSLSQGFNLTFDDIFTPISKESLESNVLNSKSETSNISKGAANSDINSKNKLCDDLHDINWNSQEKSVWDYDDFFEQNVPEESTVKKKDPVPKNLESDAIFSSFFKSSVNDVNKNELHVKEDSNKNLIRSEFTQICDNTQLLKDIDNAINQCNHNMNPPETTNVPQALKKNPEDKNEQENLMPTFLDDKPMTSTPVTSKSIIRKKTITSPTTSRKIDMEDTFNFKLSQILKNPQYRREMELQFDRVEESIYEFGTNQDVSISRTKKSPTRDVIENLLERTFKSPEIIKKVLQSAEESIRSTSSHSPWSDDSLLANAVINMSIEGQSIGSLIKKALLDNVKKNVTQQTLVNATIKEEDVVFRNYGEFYGLPDRVKDLIKMDKGIDKLYEWQDECLNLPAVKTRKNLVYALPTSGGKTLVAEILILREVLCRKKNVLFVLPYVAIVQEKVWALSSFAVGLEFIIEEYAGGKGNYPPRKRRRKNSVYIATIEKALGLMNSLIEMERTDEVGLIVVDELHLIGDKSRGSTLEELLTKVKHLKDKIQIVGMSATIGNLEEICEFLEADVYTKNFRPVELVEYVKCGQEIARVDWNAASEDDILVFERKVDYRYSNTCNKLDPDHLGGLVLEVIPKDSCLIFCRSKQNCENVATLLCKIIPSDIKKYKAAEREQIKKALKDETGSLCKVLKITITYGIAYHHSGLTSEERRIIEEGFRQGVISVICCTSTLAAGVNLPAKRVIIRNPYVGREFINLSSYKQMVGRAGRAGFGEKGESILISTPQELPRVRDLFKSPMDVTISGMHKREGRGLQQFILSCISLKMACTKIELEEIVSTTLMSIQRDKLEVDLKKITRATIKNLFKKGALQIEGEDTDTSTEMPSDNVTVNLDTTNSENVSESKAKSKRVVTVTNESKLVISKMGRASLKGGLDLGRAHMLYEDLLQAQYNLVLFSGLHLMYLVTPYEISEQISPTKSHYYTLYSQLSESELRTANVLGLTEAVAAKLLTNRKITEVPERVLNRFYITLILYELWNEVPLYEVATKYDVNRGLIQNLMTAAATFASNVVHFCMELQEFWPFALLLRGMSDRLSHCCVKELIPLMNLPSVKQNRAKQLFQAGYKTLQSIAKADPNDLVQKIEYMSRKLANQLIATSKLFLLEKVENLREEAEDVLEGVDL